ncbi:MULTISPECIES: DUF192 domain-containing protein [unclassified Pseudoalteromonas]|uniref:DUF192 domain-containing protein n=1 Tax=unclassified Pseudoalteromonas TaxID=194690 RepID=UPI000CF6A6B0|nr:MULTISPECIES: DUF192 domain-containing protein [unclassified Pseudoalteromonas]
MKSVFIPIEGKGELELFIANSWWLRFRGLLGRVIKPNQALLITPCSSIHTMWMNYSIDVLYLDKEKRIVAIKRDLKPWKFSACSEAYNLIELLSGQVDYWGFKEGNIIEISG